MDLEFRIVIPDKLGRVLEELPFACLVGGCVRDALLGYRPKDLDIEVYQTDPDLAVQLKPTSIHDLGYVIEADHSGRPPFPAGQPKEMEEILHAAESLGCVDGPQLPLLTGQMIVDRNIPEGEAVGVIFRAAYQAQIQGTISTKEQAIEWFFRNRRQILENGKLAPKKLIQATELMAIGIKPGPTLGKILNELYELQLDGKLKTREEAAEHLREILRRIKIQEKD